MKGLWMYDGGIWTWMWEESVVDPYDPYTDHDGPLTRLSGVGWRDNDGNLWMAGGAGIISTVQ
jgi:hypothetical protein